MSQRTRNSTNHYTYLFRPSSWHVTDLLQGTDFRLNCCKIHLFWFDLHHPSTYRKQVKGQFLTGSRLKVTKSWDRLTWFVMDVFYGATFRTHITKIQLLVNDLYLQRKVLIGYSFSIDLWLRWSLTRWVNISLPTQINTRNSVCLCVRAPPCPLQVCVWGSLWIWPLISHYLSRAWDEKAGSVYDHEQSGETWEEFEPPPPAIAVRPTDRQLHKYTDRQTDGHTDRQVDWLTDMCSDLLHILVGRGRAAHRWTPSWTVDSICRLWQTGQVLPSLLVFKLLVIVLLLLVSLVFSYWCYLCNPCYQCLRWNCCGILPVLMAEIILSALAPPAVLQACLTQVKLILLLFCIVTLCLYQPRL